MKNALMLTILLALALTGIPSHLAHGQSAGATHMESAKVEQGQIVTMDVTLDRASSLSGSVEVVMFPDGSPDKKIVADCGVNAAQTKCQASVRMRLEAQTGKWVISEISFTPLSGAAKVLAKHGDASFEVVPHGEIVLPNSATISDVK